MTNINKCPNCGSRPKFPYTGHVTVEQLEEDADSCLIYDIVDESGGTIGYSIYCKHRERTRQNLDEMNRIKGTLNERISNISLKQMLYI